MGLFSNADRVVSRAITLCNANDNPRRLDNYETGQHAYLISPKLMAHLMEVAGYEWPPRYTT